MVDRPGLFDFNRLLAAIAQVESNGGVNNWPRLEVSYLPAGERYTAQGRIIVGTGRNFNATVSARWDALPVEDRLGSAASWSPWQILYHTAVDRGYRGLPGELMQPRRAKPWVLAQLQHIAGRGAQTVRDFADAWNSGSHRDGVIPSDYIAKVERAYALL